MANPSLRSWKILGFSCGTNVCEKENKRSAKEGWYRYLGGKQ